MTGRAVHLRQAPNCKKYHVLLKLHLVTQYEPSLNQALWHAHSLATCDVVSQRVVVCPR
jgi:hypothetical protein